MAMFRSYGDVRHQNPTCATEADNHSDFIDIQDTEHQSTLGKEFPMFRVSRILLVATFAAVVGICGVAAQQSSDAPNASPASDASATKASAGRTVADTKFMKAAAEGGLAEVALGQLAVEKASSREVKKFGQRMVDDHSKANAELKQLAAQKSVQLPQDLSAKDKAAKATLENLSREQFDQAYMKDMVKDHRKDVSDFQRESTSAHDPDIKKFASQTLPTLKDHLKQAESIAPLATASGSAR
jgi:putative membrane protein